MSNDRLRCTGEGRIMKTSNELLGRMLNYLFLAPGMVQAFIEVCTVSLTGQIIRKFFWITKTTSPEAFPS